MQGEGLAIWFTWVSYTKGDNLGTSLMLLPKLTLLEIAKKELQKMTAIIQHFSVFYAQGIFNSKIMVNIDNASAATQR